jgi:pimeloyl-ACP methyl ester carboxylesterase
VSPGYWTRPPLPRSPGATEPQLDAPSRFIRSPDGASLAIFSAGDGPPLVLIHGAAADHTTFRVVGPMFAERQGVHAMDRRGRGASSDARGYDIRREFEDVAAVVDALAEEAGAPVDVVGHSYGGRVGLGAALLTPNLRRLVVYEGAPAPADTPYQSPDVLPRLVTLQDEGRNEDLLETFLREIVGMDDPAVAAYRANPVWPLRVAAAPTIVREVEAEASEAAGLVELGTVTIPVLQILGGESREEFGLATAALDERLAQGRVVVIEGARHAAHHTHAQQFVAAVEAFLATDDVAD